MPEWLSPQIVIEAHGKFTPQAKPQAFSIISADFFFFIPIQKSDYDRLFFFLFLSFFLQVRLSGLSSLHLQFAYKCSVVQVGAFFFKF